MDYVTHVDDAHPLKSFLAGSVQRCQHVLPHKPNLPEVGLKYLPLLREEESEEVNTFMEESEVASRWGTGTLPNIWRYLSVNKVGMQDSDSHY